ncbi:MAG: sodium-dependent transporter [Gammaproteobacteria bacterium]|nr:sodium-dependent transporter [Gammaproteobacteria bacterium]
MQPTTEKRLQWSSQLNYLLVTTGAVIGLGNIFRFPYFTAKYGCKFILLYIIFELLISIPIFLAEIIIGRRGRQNPISSINLLSLEAGASSLWRFCGYLSIIIAICTVGYYSVNAAFPLAYFVNSAINITHPGTTLIAIDTLLTNSPAMLFGFFLIFVIGTLVITIRGINRGLESICRFVIPGVFFIFLLLAIYACSIGDAKQALLSLIDFHAGKFDLYLVFAAFAYAFFKLNVGTGCMIVYGSYLPITVRLGRSALIVAGMDAVLSLLAYFAIVPLMYLTSTINNFHALAYHIIPQTFAALPFGTKLAFLFFLATVLAAWMPMIAFAETITVTLIEKFNLSRIKATFIFAVVVLLLGISFILSSLANAPSLHPLLTAQTIIQYIPENILTPISALLIAIFAGWVMQKSVSKGELGFGKTTHCVWLGLIRVFVPIGILLLLVVKF